MTVTDIVELAKHNTTYYKQIVADEHNHIAVMSVPVGTETGVEEHPVDEVYYVAGGKGVVQYEDRISELSVNHLLFIPAGIKHNVRNTGKKRLKLLVVYDTGDSSGVPV